MTDEQRALLVDDLEDALSTAKAFLAEDELAWVNALEPMLVAWASGDREFAYVQAIGALQEAEPSFREYLAERGMEPEQIEGILFLSRRLLRRVQAFMFEEGLTR